MPGGRVLAAVDPEQAGATELDQAWTVGAVPTVSSWVVPRTRVTGEILDRLERFSLVHVVGSAGAGKTTAMVQAVAAIDRPFAWLTIADWHRSPGRLLDALIQALGAVVPELDRATLRLRGAEQRIAETAAAAASIASHRDVVLVLDDCHLLQEFDEAVAVLAAFISRRGSRLRIVLGGRVQLLLPGIGVDALDPDSFVNDEVLAATSEEAAAILAARESPADAEEALRASDGWVAGIVFETWRAASHASNLDPFGEYLRVEVRSRLTPAEDELLLSAAIFDALDTRRAASLGAEDPAGLLRSFQAAGVPATWTRGGLRMVLHPSVRELLSDELNAGSPARLRNLSRAVATAYEADGHDEQALDLYLATGELDDVRRLLPKVIVSVVERGDLGLATRYLEAVPGDDEPAPNVLARLVVAFRRQRVETVAPLVDELVQCPRLGLLVAEEPRIAAFVVALLPAWRLDRALSALAVCPPGRAGDVGRYFISLRRDDPDAPQPEFNGDLLDPLIARTLYCRGKLRELRVISTAWGRVDDEVPDLIGMLRAMDSTGHGAALRQTISRFRNASRRRDPVSARAALELLDESFPGVWARPHAWVALAEAEVAVRLERDADRALDTITLLRESRPVVSVPFYRELTQVWEGAAFLLQGAEAKAAAVLRDAVGSMRRGDRGLHLATALVYLAEAEWRLGNEGAADRATDDAYAAARAQGAFRRLLLALGDFPGVLSRRLDAEPGVDTTWHSLGRALLVNSANPGAAAGHVVAHLHDFGEPELLLDGDVVARPKIRKSLELLAYLVSRPDGRASRSEVLGALWDNRDDESSRAYLRQALHRLREALGSSVTIETEGDSLVVTGLITADSLEFTALLARAGAEEGPERLDALLEALAIPRHGRFLEGALDTVWIDDRRSELAGLAAEAGLDAAALLIESGRHLDAVELVDAALASDPFLERGWRLLMTLRGLLGDLDGVADVYRRCSSTLASIGLEPSVATHDLARTLRR